MARSIHPIVNNESYDLGLVCEPRLPMTCVLGVEGLISPSGGNQP